MNLNLRIPIFIIIFPLFASEDNRKYDPISIMRNMNTWSNLIPRPWKLQENICTKTTSCICKTTTIGFFYQCDSLFYATYSLNGLEIYCNKTSRREDISGHMLHISKVFAEIDSIPLSIEDCPPDSISDFRYPAQIELLILKCAERKEFILAPDQFRDLISLRYLRISCVSLRNLPEAIFKTTKSLHNIVMEETSIERLGKGLLSNLSELLVLDFAKNEKLSLRKTDFIGLNNLKYLGINKIYSKEIEEDFFQQIYNIFYLVINDIEWKRLPTSFTLLQKLDYLEISETFIKWIGNGTCGQQISITEIVINYNPLLDIHPDCLQMYNNSREIDLSGNRISSLPSSEILLNRLESFKFNDNGREIKAVENFIHSNMLTKIEMRNSSIQSIHKDFFRSIPKIKDIDLSYNQLTYLPEGFFEVNMELRRVSLRDNKLTSIPESLLDLKPNLTWLYISHNDISEVDFNVRQNLSSLRTLDISNNKLTRIPRDPFSSMPGITHFNISNNKISEIDTVALQTMKNISELLISGNMMKGKFFPYQQNFEYLTNLGAESNSFTEINWLHMPSLRELNLSNNLIKLLNLTVFNSCAGLKSLNLSRNKIESLPTENFPVHLKNLVSLDLSFNRLKSLPDVSELFFYASELDFLDVSGNPMERFDLGWIRKTKKWKKVSIRSSNISTLTSGLTVIVHAIVLDFSHNKISSESWPWYYDKNLKLSGKISPFVHVENLEELYLAYNEISVIGLDFRIHNSNLRILDLSHNKIKHLTYQELLFSSYRFLAQIISNNKNKFREEFLHNTNGEPIHGYEIEPYDASHILTVDLRNNLIGGIELPNAMLVRNVTSKCEKHRYSHATIRLGNNPFECGCEVIPFLRVIEEDVVLVGELWRTTRENWVLQAKIDASNLTCRHPDSVNGKMVLDTDTWMHHILPLMGFCYLTEDRVT